MKLYPDFLLLILALSVGLNGNAQKTDTLNSKIEKQLQTDTETIYPINHNVIQSKEDSLFWRIENMDNSITAFIRSNSETDTTLLSSKTRELKLFQTTGELSLEEEYGFIQNYFGEDGANGLNNLTAQGNIGNTYRGYGIACNFRYRTLKSPLIINDYFAITFVKNDSPIKNVEKSINLNTDFDSKVDSNLQSIMQSKLNLESLLTATKLKFSQKQQLSGYKERYKLQTDTLNYSDSVLASDLIDTQKKIDRIETALENLTRLEVLLREFKEKFDHAQRISNTKETDVKTKIQLDKGTIGLTTLELPGGSGSSGIPMNGISYGFRYGTFYSNHLIGKTISWANLSSDVFQNKLNFEKNNLNFLKTLINTEEQFIIQNTIGWRKKSHNINYTNTSTLKDTSESFHQINYQFLSQQNYLPEVKVSAITKQHNSQFRNANFNNQKFGFVFDVSKVFLKDRVKITLLKSYFSDSLYSKFPIPTGLHSHLVSLSGKLSRQINTILIFDEYHSQKNSSENISNRHGKIQINYTPMNHVYASIYTGSYLTRFATLKEDPSTRFNKEYGAFGEVHFLETSEIKNIVQGRYDHLEFTDFIHDQSFDRIELKLIHQEKTKTFDVSYVHTKGYFNDSLLLQELISLGYILTRKKEKLECKLSQDINSLDISGFGFQIGYQREIMERLKTEINFKKLIATIPINTFQMNRLSAFPYYFSLKINYTI